MDILVCTGSKETGGQGLSNATKEKVAKKNVDQGVLGKKVNSARKIRRKQRQ